MAKVIEPSAAEKTLDLREMTDARVSLGRHGAGLPTQAQLSFLLDHARAREAVWTSVDRASLTDRLNRIGLSVIGVDSMAPDRSIYVRRPDLGRLLAPESTERLKQAGTGKGYDVAIVVADGLSSSAVDLNAVPLIEALSPKLTTLNLSAAPIVMANQARVALGDPAGEALGVKLTIVLVGERPGLSAADSLGAYITYGPKSGNPDSGRNCVSNIRDGGLPIREAAEVIAALVKDMMKTRVSGVALKAAVAKLPPSNV
ncbi:ethanolamine ammonia-lyase subunit EutC [Aliirhizobium cellulosilyticum]|jgi:ethanolamine ammonia-lyase small subunit|uniref:Ethanolamine ammonia-lyase small subunit n=1 Tax=Aliirhizobium cellulosilyticum TaxID=393664 RepID=A0A7W6TCU2_9HYPH|nr:ethanolamine ammonia-lyase subunit EutC [Rhizobium cellulosilyticum]MBB4346440.1 ethanolamine ammonia-lyase small subunit [Rhizobium cellulosilyticum]MBB4411166.1 ethanolamine ammonia-lyase small subunit [Rhizobium cellulosilyticum]MBB4445855.1 ethanolamine ammonia-lyase small subunit [Rhizobium cellulosilyticum]